MIKPFAYIKPKTVAEAIQALSVKGAKPLAGGTDLLVAMRNGVARPALLVDLKGLSEAQGISRSSEGGVSIGAAVTMNEVTDAQAIRLACPVVAQAASTIATHQLRNRATVVGNICNGSPAADMAPPLYVYGASLLIAGPEGERRIPIQEFMIDVKRTALRQGELVLRIEIPGQIGAQACFTKKKRIKGHDLAICNVAGLVQKAERTLKVCVGSCCNTPILVEGATDLYASISDVDVLAEQVADRGLCCTLPIDDVRASADYRYEMIKVLIRSVVKQLCA